MVLGNIGIIRFACIIIPLTLFSYAHADIEMVLNSDQCIVTGNEKNIQLQLAPPCSIVKVGEDGKEFYQYENVRVYIIASAPAPLEKLQKWSVTVEDKCTLQSQAVFIENGAMSVSTIREKGLTCPQIGLDEKVYRDFLIGRSI